MAAIEQGVVTGLLRSFHGGDREALDEIFLRVLPELKRVARMLLLKERDGHTLQPTALVNEAFLRLFDGQPQQWQNSRHLVTSTVREMRRVLIDEARRAGAQKRSGGERVSTSGDLLVDLRSADPAVLIDLDRALTEMGEISERAQLVVEMMFFGELTTVEIAEVLEVAGRTIDRDWRWARAWLRDRFYPAE